MGLDDAYTRLNRASVLARRPGIVIVEEDLPSLQILSGSRSRSHEMIRALETAGRLRPVRRGAYVLVDPLGVFRPGVLDLIAALTPRPYLVTAGRALEFHDLTDQHFRRIDVLVPSQHRSWGWRGDEVYYSRTKRPLEASRTRTRKTPAAIASAERAIADSLDRPSFGVTISQVVQALDIVVGRDPEAVDRLAVEVARHFGHALARRFGFLVERLIGPDAARPFVPLLGTSKAAVLLSPAGPVDGPIAPEWRVRENVEFDRLLEHRMVG